MGKYQRDWAEEAEIEVANGLNNLPVNEYIVPIVDQIRKYIAENYKEDIFKAEWAGGNDYADRGDVHVFLKSSTKVPIELKFSKETGSGTAKNPSTTIFKKKLNIDIKSYPEFDSELGLKLKRFRLVENKIGRALKNDADYKRQLRHYRDTLDPIIDVIADITAPGQVAYAEYASKKLNNYLTEVNTLVNLLLGSNDAKIAQQDLVYCVVKKFGSKKQTVEFQDFTSMDRTITRVESVGKSIKFLNKNGKDVLRFSVHWKNICQGGATPCFNVFIGNEYDSSEEK